MVVVVAVAVCLTMCEPNSTYSTIVQQFNSDYVCIHVYVYFFRLLGSIDLYWISLYRFINPYQYLFASIGIQDDYP